MGLLGGIASGYEHTCGFHSGDGTVFCWGANDRRETRVPDSLLPGNWLGDLY